MKLRLSAPWALVLAAAFLVGSGGCSESKPEEGPRFADPAKNNQPPKRFQRAAPAAAPGAPARDKAAKAG